jgi:hypothetical protein
MGDKNSGIVHDSSELGIVASHAAREFQPLLVAPTDAEDFNVVSLDLIPVACLGLHDILFEFDSSFVTPRIGVVMKKLPALRDSHKNRRGDLPPVSVFGHADPVGKDEYNKQLSGRRAKAIRGLLLHDASIWKKLRDTPLGGDDWKAKGVEDTMRAELEGLGQTAPASFPDLASAYMEAICPVHLTKEDFLGRGQGKDAKADLQGCGEFNPLLILSKNEAQSLPTFERNQRNASNRRVVIFLFRAGTKIHPDLWPCPTTEELSQGCRNRFFSDADKRRNAGAERREYAKTLDTWACRFYDRVAGESPCERPAPRRLAHISVLLRSNSGCVPLANRPYKVFVQDQVLEGATDADGLVSHEDIPPDDYKLEIDGHSTFVPTTPKSVTRCVHQVEGYYLFPAKS